MSNLVEKTIAETNWVVMSSMRDISLSNPALAKSLFGVPDHLLELLRNKTTEEIRLLTDEIRIPLFGIKNCPQTWKAVTAWLQTTGKPSRSILELFVLGDDSLLNREVLQWD